MRRGGREGVKTVSVRESVTLEVDIKSLAPKVCVHEHCILQTDHFVHYGEVVLSLGAKSFSRGSTVHKHACTCTWQQSNQTEIL